MELLIKTMNRGRSVHIKFIAVISKKGIIDFKLFKINLNVLLIDGSSIFSAKKDLISTDFLRFFLNVSDASFFNTFVPFNKMQVLSCLSKEKEDLLQEGRFTDASIKDTISAMVEGVKDRVINNVTILANKALFISKLAEKYDLLY